MTLLLIRHGETALNVARVMQPADTPLNTRGMAQADALARRLSSTEVRAIVSSDLPRALHTARAIGAATGAPLETTPLLQERNFGDWRGRPYDSLAVDPMTMDGAPPNGESAAAFAARVARAFAHILQRQAALGGTVAVVTHGLVIRALLATHVRLGDDMVAPTHLGNTGLSCIDTLPPYRVRLLDCTAHLDKVAPDDPHALAGG